MANNGEAKTLDIPVSFGDVGIGDGTARIGMQISRDNVSLSQADHMFGGARIEIELRCDPNAKADVDGQQVMDGVGVEIINSVADAKSFRTSVKLFSSTLSFKYDDALVSTLAHFAKRSGRLIAKRVGDAGADETESAEAA